MDRLHWPQTLTTTGPTVQKIQELRQHVKEEGNEGPDPFTTSNPCSTPSSEGWQLSGKNVCLSCPYVRGPSKAQVWVGKSFLPNRRNCYEM